MQLKVLVVHNLCVRDSDHGPLSAFHEYIVWGSFVFTQDIPESMSDDWIFRKSCLALVTCGKLAA